MLVYRQWLAPGFINSLNTILADFNGGILSILLPKTMFLHLEVDNLTLLEPAKSSGKCNFIYQQKYVFEEHLSFPIKREYSDGKALLSSLVPLVSLVGISNLNLCLIDCEVLEFSSPFINIFRSVLTLINQFCRVSSTICSAFLLF